jgi:hypothetical protein
MKSENVNGWHLVRFMARWKFHRVPDLIAPIGKNAIRRSVDGPQINDNQLLLMFFEYRCIENFHQFHPGTICLASQLALNSK